MSETETLKPSTAANNAVVDGFLTRYRVKIDPHLLGRALTHRSWSYENDRAPHNERLEFLGDSVLGIAVTAHLYKHFPKVSEGELAKRRAAVVSTAALAKAARVMGLGAHIRLGKGERASGGSDKDSILADTLEAVIGAVYLSTDVQTAMQFVLRVLESQLTNNQLLSDLDPKTTLQELSSAAGLPHPQYTVVGEGPDHARVYTATVSVLGVTARGEGSSKKAAELAAAARAVSRLKQLRAKTAEENNHAGAA